MSSSHAGAYRRPRPCPDWNMNLGLDLHGIVSTSVSQSNLASTLGAINNLGQVRCPPYEFIFGPIVGD